MERPNFFVFASGQAGARRDILAEAYISPDLDNSVLRETARKVMQAGAIECRHEGDVYAGFFGEALGLQTEAVNEEWPLSD